MRNTKKGFTLVELLVVIAILAILATVSVVGYTSFIDRANQSTALQEMTQIRDSVIAEDILNPNFSISGGTITVADNTDTSYPNFNDYVKSLTDALGEGRSFDELATGANALVLKNTDKKVQATWSFADNTIETDKLGNDEPVAPPAGGGDEGGAAACEHEWVDATCVAPKTCGKCGETEGEPNPDAHDMVADPESFVAATCTTDGREAGTKCSRCTHKVAGAVIPAAHSFAAEWTSDSAQHWHACSIAGCTGKTDIGNHNWNNNYACVECEFSAKATITFDNTAKRITYTTSKQVWEENGITLINNKASSQSNIGDYYNPVRFYKSSNLVIEYPGMMSIVFNCDSNSYANDLKSSIGTNATVDGTSVVVVFDSSTNSFEVSSFAEQVRVGSIDVYTIALDIPENPGTSSETAEATLSFASTAQRTTFTTSKQVWKNDIVTFTNNKASSSSNVADYSNPVRLYAGSNAVITVDGGKINKIVFVCDSTTHATNLVNSIGTLSDATVSTSGSNVTVEFTDAVESFTIASFTKQTKLSSITVSYTLDAQ